MSKINKKAKQELFIQLLTNYKTNNVITWHHFQHGQFRVFTPNKTIDFFLSGMRWHNIKDNTRGDVSSLQDFHLYI
jgi:hypothetical protein